MTIKLFYIILPLTIGIAACRGPVTQSANNSVDWAMQLDSPSKDALDKNCNIEINEIVRHQKDSLNDCDRYYFQNELYSGWACEIIPDNRHKYRYEQFENGQMIRRIGYYDNGQLDADFRMKNCKNYGPSRMWLYDGRLYIDEFYITPGLPHGIQRQWHDNGVLAKESRFENGQLIYQRKYDRSSELITQE